MILVKFASSSSSDVCSVVHNREYSAISAVVLVSVVTSDISDADNVSPHILD